MKRTFFAFAALATIFAGCSKEVDTQTPEEIVPVEVNVVTLHASVPEDTDTKVVSDNAGAYAWQAGDKITVFNTATPTPVGFEFATVAGGTSVDFSSDSFTGTLSSVAMYPASANHTSTTYRLEPSFDWVAKSSMMPMIGVVDAENQEVAFKAVGGVIKLVCFNVHADARKLIVTSDSKKITGDFTPSGTPAVISTAAKGASDNVITINFSAGHPTNMVFYVPVPTGDLGKLTFEVKDGSDVLVSNTTTTKAKVEFSRNQIIAAPVLNCAKSTILWSEDWSDYSKDQQPSAKTDRVGLGGASITYSEYLSGTKVYAGASDNYAGGTAPELLVNKGNGYFRAEGIPTNGASTITLTFLQNNPTKPLEITVSSGESGVSIYSDSEGSPRTIVITNSKKESSFDITFKNTESSSSSGKNIRLDNIVVSIAGASFTAPTITPTSSDLEIAIAAGATNSASTTFTYTNNVDDLGVSAVVNAAAAEWLSASIEGTTLTVSANKNDTGSDREGTVTLRASGATATVNVTQPNAKVATPSFSTNGGTFNNNQSITLSCDTEGATIRYTTDGTTPTSSTGTEYSSAIPVSTSTTIKAIAYKTNWIDSAVNTQEYAFVVGTPSFDPAAGAIAKGTVSISTTTEGATVYYTTTNDDYPSANWTAGSSVTVNSAQTVRAIAVKSGYTNSEIGSAAYTISKVATPTFSPVDGSAVKSGAAVTISCTTPDAVIHYTTDGTTPTASSSTYDPASKPTITAASTIKAIAVKTNWDDSEVGSASYTIDESKSVTFTPTSRTEGTVTGDKTGITAEFSNSNTSSGGVNQMTGGTSYTVTISGLGEKTITGASINAKSNKSSGTGSVTIETGSTTIGSKSWATAIGSEYKDFTITVTETTVAKGGTVVMTFSASVNSMYFGSLTLSYTD